jgi:sugar-specific transcriptional regulator TrmB
VSDLKRREELKTIRTGVTTTPPTETQRKREELKTIRFAQAPPPKQVTTIGEAQKAQYYFKGAAQEAQRRITQAEAIKNNLIETLNMIQSAPHQYQILDPDTGIYRNVIGRDIDRIQSNLTKLEDYISKTSTSKAQSEKNIKELQEWSAKIPEKVVPSNWVVTYVEDGKEKTKTFSNEKDAQSFIRHLKREEQLIRKTVSPVTSWTVTYRDVDGKEKTKTFDSKRDAQKWADDQWKRDSIAGQLIRQSDAVNWLADFIRNDVTDKKLAEKVIEELSPIYATSVRLGPSYEDEFKHKLNLKLRELEAKAEWEVGWGGSVLKEVTDPDLYSSYPEWTGPPEKVTPEMIKARLAHAGLSATIGAATALPSVIMGTVGGPVVWGLLTAAGLATLVNPSNREAIAKYVREHPQEFIAGIAGALAAGYSVAKVRQMWDSYTRYMSAKDKLRAQAQWAKAGKVDPTYFEQRVGGRNTWPGEVFEKTDDLGNKYFVDGDGNAVFAPDWFYEKHPEYGPGAWDERNALMKLIKSDPDGVAKLLAKQDLSFPYERDGVILNLELDELIRMHPELTKPTYIPLEGISPSQLTALEKAGLVARAKGGKYIVVPLWALALADGSRTGYISKSILKRLINENEKLTAIYKKMGITSTVTWSVTDLTSLELEDLAQLVNVVPISITGSTITPIQEPILEVTPELTPEVTTGVTPEITPEVHPPEEPPPGEEKLKPIIPTGKGVEERRQKPQLGEETYRVKFTYYSGRSEVHEVSAKSFQEAFVRGLRARRNIELLHEVDIRRIR